MMPGSRVVLDTNVLVSGLIKPSGTLGAVVDALRDGRFLHLHSPATLEELVDVLARPWLEESYGIRSHDVEAFLKLLLLRGEQVNPGREIRACRDPKDDKFLEVAVAGRADVLVSGDADLQSLHPFERVRILSPALFLERLSRPLPASPADTVGPER
jgi:putative PIN family toxin of toxin-antitoxin system